MAELKGMSSVEGWGGWKNQLGNITAPTLWKGVTVAALAQLVGGGGGVVIVASDGYEQPFTAAELAGGVAMYHPSTGSQISTIEGSLKVIVAYSQSGAPIGADYGPLRIAFVSPENEQVTDGSSWVKWVVELRMN
jgi:hypothetical protein